MEKQYILQKEDVAELLEILKTSQTVRVKILTDEYDTTRVIFSEVNTEGRLNPLNFMYILMRSKTT